MTQLLGKLEEIKGLLDMVFHWDRHQIEQPTVTIYMGDSISFSAKEEHLSQWLDRDCRIWSFFQLKLSEEGYGYV